MKSFKALFGLLVIVGLVILASKLIPPYFANFQFQDDVTTVARFASVDNRTTDDGVRDEILKKAKQYDIELKPEQVQVTRDGRQVYILVVYDVTVDLVAGRSYTFHFEDASENKAKELMNKP